MEKETCAYKIHHPFEEDCGLEGHRYYECTCRRSYIDIETAIEQEWEYCPYCGKRIEYPELMACVNCEHAEYDGYDHTCENKNGRYWKEYVGECCFDGCMCYKEREVEEV